MDDKNEQQEPKHVTVTLTGRPPVRIDKNQWGVVARASDEDYDNQYRFQANRTSDYWIVVRERDGKYLVYAGYTYATQFQGESNRSERAGELLEPGASMADVVSAIQRVAKTMQAQVGAEDEPAVADTFARLGRECIADLPAEHL